MAIEKRTVVLSGEGGANGTLRLTSRDDAIFCEYALRGVGQKRLWLSALCGENRTDYPLRGERGGLELDGEIDALSTHFVVFCDGRAALYGTPSPRRLNAESLPPSPKERDDYAAKTDLFERETDVEFEARASRVADIFPSGEAYADDAVAQVNFYSAPLALTDEKTTSERFPRDETDDFPRENSDERETDNLADFGEKSRVLTDDEVEIDDVRGDEPFFPRSLRGAGRESFFDLTRRLFERDDETAPPLEPEPPREAETVTASGLKLGSLKARIEGEQPAPPPEGRRATFYELMKDELEKLFALGERETDLEAAMPLTRWVKIDYSGNGKLYVVGLIGDPPDYVCYGLPGEFSETPPRELDGASWLPLDQTKPRGNGYWLLFQSATTGESVLPSGEVF